MYLAGMQKLSLLLHAPLRLFHRNQLARKGHDLLGERQNDRHGEDGKQGMRVCDLSADIVR